MHEKLKTGQKLGVEFRNFVFDKKSLDAETRTVSLSASSDEPYDRWFGKEILSHDPKSIRMDRLKTAAPLLFNHDRNQHIGRIVEASTDGKKINVKAQFSQSALGKEKMQDVQDGILQESSIGYIVHKFETDSDEETYTAKDWEPLEVSLVTIPADTTVGVGRDVENQNVVEITKKSVDGTQDASFNRDNATGNTENPDMRLLATAALAASALLGGTRFHEPDKGNNPATPTPGLTVEEADKRANAALDAEDARQSEIRAVHTKFASRGVTDEDANAFLKDRKKTPADFKMWVLENRMNAVAVVPDRDSLAAGVSAKELSQFSLVKAMHQLSERNGLTGLEKEVCDHAQKQSKRTLTGNGIIVPTEALALRMREGMQQRDLTAGTSTAGGNLVATDLLTGSFVDLLRNRLIVQAMGARMLDGLTGNVAIPRATGATAAYWVSETGATSESNSTFDQILMTPHGVSAIQDYSKLLTIQSGIGIENFVRMDIAKVLALAIDSAALAGTGTSNMPLGVLGQTGIGSAAIGTNGGPINWPTVVSLETQVATSNADIGTLGYCTNPKVRGQAKITPMQANGVEGHFIVGDAAYPGQVNMGMLNGYKLGVSNQVPSNLTKGTSSGNCSALIFGNWDDLLIGQWNGVDIVLDPYTQAPNRVIRYVVSMWVDVMVRHPQSFAACLDITA